MSCAHVTLHGMKDCLSIARKIQQVLDYDWGQHNHLSATFAVKRADRVRKYIVVHSTIRAKEALPSTSLPQRSKAGFANKVHTRADRTEIQNRNVAIPLHSALGSYSAKFPSPTSPTLTTSPTSNIPCNSSFSPQTPQRSHRDPALLTNAALLPTKFQRSMCYKRVLNRPEPLS